MSNPRRVVLAVLAARDGHVGAEELVAEVAAVDPRVHRASVYRVLEAFTDLGVVQHVHLGHGATAYHLSGEHGPHLHVQCRHCGTVQDAPAGALDEAAAVLRRRLGFHLDPGHVALSGTCRACRSH